MYTLEAVVLDALHEAMPQQPFPLVNDTLASSQNKSTFTHGDGRYIYRHTIITMPNGSVGMFCSHTYEEQKAILHANRTGGGRWLRDGSFTMFKKDMV